MQECPVWRVARVLLAALIVFTAATAVSVALPGAAAPVAEAAVLEAKDDKDKKDKDAENDDDDYSLNGQVLEINTLKDPPEMILGSVDGEVVVRVLKTDEIAMNGVEVGDYVEVTGEKIHELLFEATEISVDNSDN